MISPRRDGLGARRLTTSNANVAGIWQRFRYWQCELPLAKPWALERSPRRPRQGCCARMVGEDGRTDHRLVSSITSSATLLVSSKQDSYPNCMGEHIEQRIIQPRRIARKRPSKQTPETIGRRLLEIVVYDKRCRVGGTLTLDDLAESEIGDWKMPDFRAACPCERHHAQGGPL
jgi:hypothetical protein